MQTVYADGSVFCETTHLTDFGGIVSFPTTPEELMKELQAIRFNGFLLEEMFDALSNFKFEDNQTIMYAWAFISDLLILHLTSDLLHLTSYR